MARGRRPTCERGRGRVGKDGFNEYGIKESRASARRYTRLMRDEKAMARRLEAEPRPPMIQADRLIEDNRELIERLRSGESWTKDRRKRMAGQARRSDSEDVANALQDVYDTISRLQSEAFKTNDKVVYAYCSKLLSGELMDLKANYSKDLT